MFAFLDDLNRSAKLCPLCVVNTFKLRKYLVLKEGGTGSSHARVYEYFWVFQDCFVYLLKGRIFF